MTVRIALTTGEPAGIGPDITVAIAQHRHAAQLIAIGDPALLQARAVALGLPLTLHIVEPDTPAAPAAAGELYCLPVRLDAPVEPGVVDPANARYVLALLDRALNACRRGDADAMVTAPVHKGVINDAGIPFSGHTEYLAERTATERVVMMLANRHMRVALATTHLPLARVPAAITGDLLDEVLGILEHDLYHRFGIDRPRIMVLGLNPHAGEGGHLGREEIDVIAPVLERRRSRGSLLTGPVPADTGFTPARLADCDAVLAMYHDQGLPVLKYSGFGEAVNITLGLPIVRTSVDHGTALDLAGKGGADTGSLAVAIDYAIAMSGGHLPGNGRERA